jgi:cell division protein FtsB
MTRFQKIILIIISAAMFCLLLAMIFGDNGFVELNRMRATHDRLRIANERLTQENARLYRTIERLQNDSAFIEYTVRRELGMIRSDEYIFKFKSDNQKQ